MPKRAPRLIFKAFGCPLGSLRGSLGPTFALLGPSWHPFGDHFGVLGRPVALSWLSWDDYGRNFDGFMSTPSSGHNFDGFDVQITKNNYSKSSHLRLPSFFCTSHWHLSCAPRLCAHDLHFSFAYLMRTSGVHLSV